MTCGHSTKQSLAAAASLAALLALAPVAAAANPFEVPPVGPGVCVANCGTPPSTSSSASPSPPSSPSSASSAAERAAKRAAKLERLRQHQIQANNFRLRSIDRARSKLTYPNVIDNFFRSPSIDEQWRQETQSKIQSLGRRIAAEKARIDKILGDRPLNWDGGGRGRDRKPGDIPASPGGASGEGKKTPLSNRKANEAFPPIPPGAGVDAGSGQWPKFLRPLNDVGDQAIETRRWGGEFKNKPGGGGGILEWGEKARVRINETLKEYGLGQIPGYNLRKRFKGLKEAVSAPIIALAKDEMRFFGEAAAISANPDIDSTRDPERLLQEHGGEIRDMSEEESKKSFKSHFSFGKTKEPVASEQKSTFRSITGIKPHIDSSRWTPRN
jgi:hypothetical protein